MKYEIIKGSEKDFDLAPEWATFKERNTSGDLFFSEGHSVGCRVQGITTKHDFTFDDGNNDFTHLTLIAERRPITEQAWDGKGLPPAGCICEYRGNDTSWGEVKIIGHDEGKVVFKPSGEDYYGITPSHKAEFIPIRSSQDVARDKAVAKMVSILNEGTSTQDDARDIYDAIASGKIPGVKLG
ncbi:hypothetical protein [Rahnella sikkimica]|uniref:Uncharacterized protein n=1 Tax=Rahnella sikkimica TaxID=1805933 RepID=A0A2L1UN37_9GAMM|nr:hypothetical protein [Rahnella sikkimica]AVF34238.1 hypothetical protein BV494_04500 [Rahnella sikkimica]